MPRKSTAKQVALAVILVSTFAVSMYYLIPNSPRTRSIAFALGPSFQPNSVNSSVYSLTGDLTVTFQNGTKYYWNQFYNTTPAEINSTETTQIVISPGDSFSGGLDLKEPYLVTVQYAFDWGIHAYLAGENPMDLGTLQADNLTYSGYISLNNYPIPQNFSVPDLNYTRQVSATGYWETGNPPIFGPWIWRIDADRIQSIISNATNPAKVSFDLDLTVNVYYQIMTNDATQSGYATVSWSGTWATLQLLHEGNQLHGFRYSYLDIGLRLMAT